MPYAAVNGLTMYYEVHGDGSPLLLLHGGGSSIPEKWIPFFTPHFRVVAPEQMGNGRTGDLVHRPFHYHDMAEDTVALMRHLGIKRAGVVGYSDGGIEERERIEAPTLLIVGDDDIVMPEHAVEMFRTIPRAQLCIVPNAGHGAMPEETVVTFLRELAGI
jgi:pimeloyl-ACP methyl ester carboxylesterase